MTQKRNITIDDIARDLGVSKTTVSRAISGKGRISENTRAKVMEYIEACNYRPNPAARGLAENRTYNLALVLPKSFIQMNIPFYRHTMNSICEEAFAWDYNIVICLSTEEFPESLRRTLDNRKVDGVILSRTVENDSLVDMLKERGIPFATIGSLPSQSRGWATVEADHDHVSGCNAFTLSFLQGSREKVGLLGNDMRYMVNKSRYSGFLQAVAALKYPEENIFMRTGLNKPADCTAAVRELLNQGVRKFLCMDDEICMYTLTALMQAGKKIPEDVQIASLFDSEKLCSSPIGISALHFDAAELGMVACRELLKCLRDERYDPSPILGYRIISRESTL